MPKKVTSNFNLSAEIRELLKVDPKSTLAEVQAAIVSRYPKFVVNKNSFLVAFYTIRKKLGIGKPSRKAIHAKSANVAANALQSAAEFVGIAGSFESAIHTLKQLEQLQIA